MSLTGFMRLHVSRQVTTLRVPFETDGTDVGPLS
jgi:hypothetical protein